MPSDYGSLSWMARTNGRMSPMEQARELAAAVKAEAQRTLVGGRLIDAQGLSVANVLPPDGPCTTSSRASSRGSC